MGTEIQQNATKVRQAGGFYFHMGVSEGSDLKIMGQTRAMLHNAFTVFIHDMLTVLSFLSLGVFPLGALW